MGANFLNSDIALSRNERLRCGVGVRESYNARDVLETTVVVHTNLEEKRKSSHRTISGVSSIWKWFWLGLSVLSLGRVQIRGLWVGTLLVRFSQWPIRPAVISSVCSMKQLGVLLRPASPSQGYLQHYIYRYSFIPLGGELEALWEQSVLPKNTTQCPRPGLEPRPLDPDSSVLTILVAHIIPARPLER